MPRRARPAPAPQGCDRRACGGPVRRKVARSPGAGAQGAPAMPPLPAL